VHHIWTVALEYRTNLWVERVASDDNIADCPSRFEYQMLEDLDAIWITPRTGREFLRL